MADRRRVKFQFNHPIDFAVSLGVREEIQQRLIIEFNRADALYWRDLLRYRELFAVLAWRDLSVRYKETVFGVLWALVRPFLTMLVFTAIFGRLAKLPSDGNVPYPLMVLVG